MIHFEPPFFLLIATLACLWFDGNDDGGIGVDVDALMLMLMRKRFNPHFQPKNILMMAIMLTVMMIKENPFLLIMATLARLLINHRI